MVARRPLEAPRRTIRAFLTLAPLLLAACTAQETAPEGGGAVPVAFRLALSGDTEPVLGPDGSGQLRLRREGAQEPTSLDFTNGRLAVHGLAPGRYEVTGLGALQCRDLAFEVATAPRYLGAIDAELIAARSRVALMSPASVSSADVAALAGQAGTAAEAVDARPLGITEAAPCFLGPDGPRVTWEDLPLEDKILLSVSLAGFCAVALVAGGFCMF